MKDLILSVLGCVGVVLVIGYAMHRAISTPDVYMSNSTKQCVKIVDADGQEHSCKIKSSLDSYNVVWVQ